MKGNTGIKRLLLLATNGTRRGSSVHWSFGGCRTTKALANVVAVNDAPTASPVPNQSQADGSTFSLSTMTKSAFFNLATKGMVSS